MMGDRFGWCQKQDDKDEKLDKSYDYAIENHSKTLGWIENYRFDTSVTQVSFVYQSWVFLIQFQICRDRVLQLLSSVTAV